MTTWQPQRRRKSSTTHQVEIPSFLENSPFFIPFTADIESHAAKHVPKPTFTQILRSKNARAGFAFLIGAILFWCVMPRKGDISYEALGRWGLLHGGGAQCLYDPKAFATVPTVTSRNGREFEGLDWEKLAYVTYVTHREVLCNAVMLFESLKRLGSKGKRVMLIPDTEEFLTVDYSSRSSKEDAIVKRLLIQAEKEYSVVLVRVKIVRKSLSYKMWQESYTKLLAFNLTAYDRLIVLDSDATLLKPMDELFLLAPTVAAMPRAYWLDTPTLASHIMLITPSAIEFERVEKAVHQAGLGHYDMEIVNALYGASCVVLPHKPYALLTGEFRRPKDRHHQYLDSGETWDAGKITREVSLVHFSDYPMPKPWEDISETDIRENNPKCIPQDAGFVQEDKEDCDDQDAWVGFYRDFRERRLSVCGLEV